MNDFMNYIIVLVIGISGAFIYGLFFRQHEDKIRAYLKARRHGWARRRYVKAFIAAFRGHTATTDTYLLALLILSVVFAASLYFKYLSFDLDKDIRSLEQETERLLGSFDEKATLDSKAIEEKKQVTRKKLQAIIEEKRQAARKNVQAIYEDNQSKKSMRKLTVLALDIYSGLLIFVLIVGYIAWVPYLVMRRYFAFDVERFTLRIQGLASKAELAELALAELKVSDEKTLRRFVDVAARVAKRCNVSELITTFELWI